MAKRKNWVDQLTGEKYFVWAVLFAVVVSGAVLGQIAIAKTQMDTDILASSAVVTPHIAGAHITHLVHKRK